MPIMITEEQMLSQVGKISTVDRKERVILMSKQFDKLTIDEMELVGTLNKKGWIIQYSMF